MKLRMELWRPKDGVKDGVMETYGSVTDGVMELAEFVSGTGTREIGRKSFTRHN